MKKTDSKLHKTPYYEVVGAEFSDDDHGVDVLVEYCATGNYRPAALALARAIVHEVADPDVRVRLAPVRDGHFEVHVAGRLIFSKKATYRLPEADEIFYHVAAARAALEKRLAYAV